MSKDHVVLLVSRAIAVIQCITAILEISYLPERLMWFYHYRNRGTAQAGSEFLDTYHSTGIGLLCFRIAALLLLTYIFWQCGPRVRAFLLHGRTNGAPPEEAPVQS